MIIKWGYLSFHTRETRIARETEKWELTRCHLSTLTCSMYPPRPYCMYLNVGLLLCRHQAVNLLLLFSIFCFSLNIYNIYMIPTEIFNFCLNIEIPRGDKRPLLMSLCQLSLHLLVQAINFAPLSSIKGGRIWDSIYCMENDKFTTSQHPLTWGWALQTGLHSHVRGCCGVVV
jgi:hypothetical protein